MFLPQQDFLYIIFIPKLASLIIYAFFIAKLQLKESISLETKSIKFWRKGIYNMHVLYVLSYIVYGISISGILFEVNSFIYHSQIAAMSIMVLYVSRYGLYTAKSL